MSAPGQPDEDRLWMLVKPLEDGKPLTARRVQDVLRAAHLGLLELAGGRHDSPEALLGWLMVHTAAAALPATMLTGDQRRILEIANAYLKYWQAAG